MFTLNSLPSYGEPLAAEDAAHLDLNAALQIEELLRACPAHAPTQLHALPRLNTEGATEAGFDVHEAHPTAARALGLTIPTSSPVSPGS